MFIAVIIRLVVAETPEILLPGIKIALYDHDQASMDDHLGNGVTDTKGEFRFVFESESYTDEDDLPLWKVDSLPDLYVNVFNHSGEIIYSTREDFIANDLPGLISIGVPQYLVEAHGLG